MSVLWRRARFRSSSRAWAAAQKLSNHVGQFSDLTLVELIDQIWKYPTEIAEENQQTFRESYAFGKHMGSDSIDPGAMETEVKDWLSSRQASIDRRQSQHVSINKRIEELLAGDDAT